MIILNQLLGQRNDKKDTNLAISKNVLCVNKFCEIAQLLNVDPMHKWALHIVIILMCKNINAIEVARKFGNDVRCPQCVQSIEEKIEMYNMCSVL